MSPTTERTSQHIELHSAHAERHDIPDASNMPTLFSLRKICMMGPTGLTSFSDKRSSFMMGATSTSWPGFCASTSASRSLSASWGASVDVGECGCFSSSSCGWDLGCTTPCPPTTVDVSELFAASCASTRRRTLWYVRLRSRRNVSLKKRNATKQSPVKIARNQKTARQSKTCVRKPPMMGPREGPRRGALREGRG